MQTSSRNPVVRSAPPPARRANANATQEVQAADVLEVIEKGALAKPAPLPRFEDALEEVSVEIVPDVSPRFRTSSASSIAPVDLNLAPPLDDEMTGSIDVVAVARRKRFSLIVGAAVGACAALLLIAIGSKLAGGSSDTPEVEKANAFAAPTQIHLPTVGAQSPATSSPVAVAQAATPIAAASPGHGLRTIGTLIIDSKAKKVWLDGKRLSGTSAMIQCGAHKVKIGRSSAQSVDVACGGETHVSR